jgi:drug/metabolite transporter (DMT)-like permease
VATLPRRFAGSASARWSPISATVALLIALGAIAHATWNLTLKRVGQAPSALLWLTFVVGAIAFAPMGIASLATAQFEWWWVAFATVCGIFEVAYFLLLQRGYRVGDVSLVYPIARGTGPMLSVVGAVVLLGETPSSLALLGVVVIITGIAVIGLAGSRGPTKPGAKSIVYGLAVGVLIASFTVWDGWSVGTLELPPVGYYWIALVAQAVLFIPSAFPKDVSLKDTIRRYPVPILTIGVLGPASYILALTAIQLSSVSLVAPAREISVVLVALGGGLLFREPHMGQRLIGSAIVLSGVVLLAIG